MAAEIGAGDLDLAVICGAEALDTKRRLKKAGERPDWSFRHPDPPPFPFEAPFHPSEVAHEVFQAWLTFATRDVARRARLGVAPDGSTASNSATLLAPMTEIAVDNPNAWFPIAHDAAELITPTPTNRMVGYPYTKAIISIMDVDMAGAMIVASHEAADGLGVPAERRVYLRGWAESHDPVYVAEHPDLARSPSMAWCFERALGTAGVGTDDVAHLDLYSCFSSSVLFAAGPRWVRPVLRRAARHRDRRPALRRRRGQQLPGPRRRDDGRSAAGRSRLVRSRVGCRDAHDQAQRRRVLHRPTRRHAARAASRLAGSAATVPIVELWDGPGTVAAYSVAPHGPRRRAGMGDGGRRSARAAAPTGESRTAICSGPSRPRSGSAGQSWRPASARSTG